jgi:predicted acetyltransferase
MEAIRYLYAEEREAALQLSAFAFQFKAQDVDLFRSLLMPEQVLGYFVNEQLAAKVWVIPLELYYGERKIKMAGIANVASWPEFRRKGMVGELMIRALKDMKAAGQSVSCLAPFSYAFYRRYGYEAFTDVKTYKMEPKYFPRFEMPEGSFENATWKHPAIQEVYEMYAQKYHGMLVRDLTWWEKRIHGRADENWRTVLFRDALGSAQGYILYRVAERVMHIRELVYLTEEARRALWRFAANHDSMITEMVSHVPVSDNLAAFLPEPRFKQEIVPYFMARIVDVEGFFQQITFNSLLLAGDEAFTFRLSIHDEYAPWNQGTFNLSVDPKGRIEIEKMSDQVELFDEEHPTHADLLCTDIQALTSMMFGYIQPGALHRAGKIQCRSQLCTRLEQRIPRREPFLSDYF